MKPKLPPGQIETKKWPVLDLGQKPSIPLEKWRLDVDGLVARPVSLSWDDFMKLEQVEDVSDFHCVTTWSRFDNKWKGVRFSTIAALAGVKPEARFVLATAHDKDSSGVPYTTNFSLASALEPDVLLVHTWEGKPLPLEHGGPVRMITPKLYAWKGAKWIQRITFLAQDHSGYWEVRGYSDTADPWMNDRYS
jgi:DMSO/TMAO reductase YedYZ molybdopterin-dependent catalytic subunit